MNNKIFITKYSIHIKLVMCICPLLFLNSCFPRMNGALNSHNLNKLEMNMTSVQTENILTKPLNTIQVNKDGLSNYNVWYYREYKGMISNIIAVCFKSDKLVYWGYPHEFARLDNAELNKVIKLANAEKNRLDSLKNED